jgi:hypothetical protein
LSETSTVEGQAPETDTGQAPTTPDGQAPEGTRDDQSQSMSPEEAQKLRREAAERRVQLRQAEKEREELRSRLEALEEQGKTEEQRKADAAAKAEQRAQDAEQRAREAELRSAVALRAPSMEIVDAKAALRLMDQSAVSFGKDGSVDQESIDAALSKLLDDFPFLKAQAPRPGAGAPPNPGRGDGDPPGETDAQKRARLFGGAPPAWASPSGATAQGGGVVWNTPTTGGA